MSPAAVTAHDPLAPFSRPTRDWFAAAFAGPTDAQAAAWRATAAGGSVLVSAPTGSGKTLAAFLAALDRLFAAPVPTDRGARTRVLYISPLKALAYDVDRNLRAPLVGITRAAERIGEPLREITVGMRTGDTPPDERRRLARTPPDILITTPESLFLLLTSRAREGLAHVETVIVDEVHAVAATKRGAHLALSLERLERLVADAQGAGDQRRLQRVGLSATQRPLDEVGRFLCGGTVAADGSWSGREVQIVEAPGDKVFDLEIVVPVEDMGRLGEVIEEPPTGPAAGAGESRRSIWPAVHPRILELVRSHRSTIVFANSRRLAERLCSRLNELHAEQSEHAGDSQPVELIARAHHGSVSREERFRIEEDLKAGRLPCVVATSSLELGIDMGAVDLVIQVSSPGSVASGLQRVGRAGHQVGAGSVGKIFPKYRGDLVECAVVVRRMRAGDIELTRYPRTPLDVLAQQIVAMAAMDSWGVDDLHAAVRGAAGFADLTRAQLDGVLDMLSGRYPSDEFAELRPRITWDRVTDEITGRPGAQRLAVTSGGTIPDRGLFGVFLAGAAEGGAPLGSGGGGRAPRRVGELDEEMVYETRPGETIVLGASTWRIDDITRDQVLVTPAPGEPGKLPFWHGDALGRPVEVGRAVGAFLREAADLSPGLQSEQLAARYDLDALAAANLVAYLAEQREATGVLPSDRTLVVERFRDEIGDWRVVLHSPFGARVHAPWALAIEARAREQNGIEVSTMTSDDGIVIRLPDTDWDAAASGPPAAQLLRSLLLPDHEDVEELVVGQLADSALFAARFRECAARALLLPRRRPGGRTPLWQQRQRAADLLAVASRYGSFPILLETYRECLRDVFDVPALVEVLRDVAARRVRVVEVDTPTASPFASSLLFDYIAGYMYSGDAPLAERRASALALDRELLAELLGSEELRELIDADALDDLELELQRLTEDRAARSPDAVHDLLRQIGDLSTDEVAARVVKPARAEVGAWLDGLQGQRRVVRLRIADERRWAAAEDAARFRDALGIPPPAGLPEAFVEPVDRPTVDLVARYARTHGPFLPEDVTARLGLPRDAVVMALATLEDEGRVWTGEFRPGGHHREWVDAEVLRRLRRRSLSRLRREVEPVEPAALARFLPAWQGVRADAQRTPGGGDLGRVRADAQRTPWGVDRTFEVVEQLQGAAIPASVLERDVLRGRIAHYTPAWLDELCAAGALVWVGRGGLGSADGRIALYARDQAPLLAPAPPDRESLAEEGWWSELHGRLLEHLERRGAAFWSGLHDAVGAGGGGRGPRWAQLEVVEALWDLVWAGVVTNDALAAVRAVAGGTPARGGRGRRAPRALSRSGPPRAAGRWSLVRDIVGGAPPTERGAALAAQLLSRYGVLTRDAVAAEDVPGGFSGLYPVLVAMEESGRARRGYFVEGLGGAQFALPGAVDRLRAARDGDATAPVVLAATDPANPYGAALPWPDPPAADAGAGPGGEQQDRGRHRARRAAGAHVVLLDGDLVCFVERGGRSLVTYTAEPDRLAVAAAALGTLVDERRVDRLSIRRIDGAAPDGQPIVAALQASGFADTPRGLVRRSA
ncbi:ATP-dependent helicase [soil metagenome]